MNRGKQKDKRWLCLFRTVRRVLASNTFGYGTCEYNLHFVIFVVRGCALMVLFVCSVSMFSGFPDSKLRILV